MHQTRGCRRKNRLSLQLTGRRKLSCYFILGDLGVISLDQECLLKTEQDLLRNEAQGFFSELEVLSFTKQQFKPSVNQYRSTEHITVLTSTTYQTRSLQVTLLSLRDGISHLEVCFTLRCLQRLSHPYAATRLCPWQNNRCTGGTSNPVLSY